MKNYREKNMNYYANVLTCSKKKRFLFREMTLSYTYVTNIFTSVKTSEEHYFYSLCYCVLYKHIVLHLVILLLMTYKMISTFEF